ncbi:hypothetical protein ABIE64_002652 [Thalassospira sp. MBR-102]|uniref:capsid assembly protein n=1 Tax=Thalassospira sp. MBR-102 TaxID=3156466 RepID=UPI003390E052
MTTFIEPEITGPDAPKPDEAPEVITEGQQADDQKEAEETPKTEDAPKQTEDETPDPYGPVISSAFDQAGLNAAEVTAHFEEHGEITPDHYSALEGAGFSRDLVDIHLAGVKALKAEAEKAEKAQEEQVVELAKADITAIKAVAGGDDGYSKMVKWAQQALPDAQLTSFNEAVSSGNRAMAEWAVKGLHAEFIKATGSRPQFVRGSAGDDGPVGFRSRQELVAAMSDPRYGKDREFTADVEARVGRSSIFGRR